MAPSSKIRHRFQNSLDMVAARCVSYVDLTQPSGTDNAWSIVDSPTLGRAGNMDSPTLGKLGMIDSPTLGDTDMIDSPILGRMSSIARRLEWISAEPSPVLPMIEIDETPIGVKTVKVEPLHIHKKANVTPIDVKKIRRRGFTTGVQLVLPPSPLPPPRSPLGLPPFTATTPQTALTFTAEWDLTQSSFVFTPFQTSYPPSATSPFMVVSPVPDDIGVDAMSVTDVHTTEIAQPDSPTSSISSSPCSEIFDTDFIYHSRKMSSSTAPSSAAPLSAKPESSSTSLTKELTIHLFEEELNRSIPPASRDTEFDKGLYEDIDEDLLMAPMDVFERLLWESTVESEARVAQYVPEEIIVKPARLSYGDRIDPNVPRHPSQENIPLTVETSLPPLRDRRINVPSPRGPRPRRKRNFSEDFVGGVFKH